MKNRFRGFGLGLALLAAVVSAGAALGATCTGDDNCRACRNCKYCRHCAREGGTCGVCKKLRAQARKEKPALMKAAPKPIQPARK
jgi:hypothetical protein